MFKAKSTHNGFIREARGKDAPLILEYIEKVCGETDYLTFGPGTFNLSEEEEHSYLELCHQRDNCLYLIALERDQIVASLSFVGGSRPRTRHAGELGMSVLKSHWGLGIGSGLLTSLVNWCKAGGIITKVNLRVRTDNARAMDLYLRHGFQLEGTLRREIMIDDRAYDFYWLGMPL